MATNDYINPTSIRPEYGWKPQGFLGGMNYARDRRRYEDVASLQDYMMKNEAQMSGGKLQDYFSDAPVRDAERASKVNKANVDTETYGGLQRNLVTKGSQENQLNAGLMSSKIAEAAAKASMEGDKSQMSQLATGAAIGKALASAAGNGPGALAGVLQQLQRSKADPRIMEWFKNSKSPQELMQKAQMINDAFLQANAAYRQAMDSGAAANASREKAAGISANATIEAAKIRQKDKVKSIDQMLQEAAKWAPDRRKSFYEQVLIDSDATPAQKDKARTGIEEAVKALNFGAKIDDPILPGLPVGERRRYGEGPGGKDKTNTGIPGVERLN